MTIVKTCIADAFVYHQRHQHCRSIKDWQSIHQFELQCLFSTIFCQRSACRGSSPIAAGDDRSRALCCYRCCRSEAAQAAGGASGRSARGPLTPTSHPSPEWCTRVSASGTLQGRLKMIVDSTPAHFTACLTFFFLIIGWPASFCL